MSTFEENWEIGLVTAEAASGIGFSGTVEAVETGGTFQQEQINEEQFIDAAD